MEIPQNVQNKLKCSECDELLSCGPVYLLHETGGTICGRCSQQSEEEDSTKNSERTRIEPYEAAASLLAFPCAFADRGCPEKLQFSLGQSSHEFDCEFRPFICPIAPRGSCDWIGSLSKFKEHCDEKHPSNIYENPCNPPRPDLTTSNLQTYLISTFNFLFLVHLKVCLTSGNLFHSVRMFADSKLLDKFSYKLEIEGNDSKVIKNGLVLRAGILTIQETTANFVLINSLLDLLGGKYDESKYTITIDTIIDFNCLNCSKNIDVSNSKFCDECQGKLLKCKFNGQSCSFVDFDNMKCMQHEEFFCEYQTKCYFCKVNFVGGSFVEHLVSSTSCRETKKSNINSVVRVTPISSKYKYILFSNNNIGTIICLYKMSNSNLVLQLRTLLLSHELKNYKCSIKLTDPQTKHAQILTSQFKYNDWDDWSINENMDNFPSWKKIGIDLKVNMFMYKNVD